MQTGWLGEEGGDWAGNCNTFTILTKYEMAKHVPSNVFHFGSFRSKIKSGNKDE